jgi:hypothetical protein
MLLERFNPDKASAVWTPLPHTSQEYALTAPVQSLLLTGGRGWGKTETQLMRYSRLVGMGYGSYWRGIIFDLEYKNLDDLVVKSKRIFYELDKGRARFLESNSSFKWVWDTGEELLFRAASEPADYWDYHGHEYPFIGFNELTKYPNPKFYTMIASTNRTGFIPALHTPRVKTEQDIATIYKEYGLVYEIGDYLTLDKKPLPEIPLEIVSTTNPYGPGHNWVKSEFIDPAPYGKRVKHKTTIFNPRTQQDEEVERTQVTLFGTFRENPYLSPSYIALLYQETDENVLKAWLTGDWDIVAGGAFDDVWRKAVHVVPRFKVPRTWHVDRCLDWGSSHPYSVGWFAEANGEEVTLEDGTKWAPPPGTIIQIAELYGTKKIGSNVGLKTSAKDVAVLIKETEIELIQGGWVNSTIYPGPADNEIANVKDSGSDTIEKKMADQGVHWEKSDKSPGSRKNGMELFRNRLQASIRQEGPGIYFMDNCRASIATIPVLPRDEKKLDDVDTKAEDHPYDMVRYRVLKGNNRIATNVVVRLRR